MSNFKKRSKPREGDMIFIYNNRQHKSEAEILDIMRKEAKGKSFTYGIYNGKTKLI